MFELWRRWSDRVLEVKKVTFLTFLPTFMFDMITNWPLVRNTKFHISNKTAIFVLQYAKSHKFLCLIVFISWRFSFGKTCLVYIYLNVCFCQITISCEASFLGTFLIGHTKFIIWDNINRSSDYETSVSSDQFGIWDDRFMTTEGSTNCTSKCRVFFDVDCIIGFFTLPFETDHGINRFFHPGLPWLSLPTTSMSTPKSTSTPHVIRACLLDSCPRLVCTCAGWRHNVTSEEQSEISP